MGTLVAPQQGLGSCFVCKSQLSVKRLKLPDCDVDTFD
jgi:hypothetical protein